MKKNIKYLFLLVILINVLLLSSCFNKVQDNQYIIISDIEIFNNKDEKMIVDKQSDESIFFFDNDVQSNGIIKITEPIPAPITYYFATRFADETSFKFIVYGECCDNVILKDMSLTSNDFKNNYIKDNYISKKIETDSSKFKVTFIVKAPEKSTRYLLSNILLDINGIEKQGYEDGPNRYAKENYGVYLKYDKIETDFEKIINFINATLTTEFKLCSDVTKLYNDIRNKDYSAGYHTSLNYWLYDIKYKDENIDYTTFANYEHVCYGFSFLNNEFTEEQECYIRQIYCSVEGYYLFGLSLDSTIDEVQYKMKELGLYEHTNELSDSVTNYYYEYEYGYISFYYNSREKKIKSFMIDVNVYLDRYS